MSHFKMTNWIERKYISVAIFRHRASVFLQGWWTFFLCPQKLFAKTFFEEIFQLNNSLLSSCGSFFVILFKYFRQDCRNSTQGVNMVVFIGSIFFEKKTLFEMCFTISAKTLHVYGKIFPARLSELHHFCQEQHSMRKQFLKYKVFSFQQNRRNFFGFWM